MFPSPKNKVGDFRSTNPHSLSSKPQSDIPLFTLSKNATKVGIKLKSCDQGRQHSNT